MTVKQHLKKILITLTHLPWQLGLVGKVFPLFKQWTREAWNDPRKVCAIRCPRQVRTEFIFVISPTGSRISTKARGLFTEEETPLVSLFQFNLLRALARERGARGPRRDHTEDTDLRLLRSFFKQETASCCFYTSCISLFPGIAPLLRDFVCETLAGLRAPLTGAANAGNRCIWPRCRSCRQGSSTCKEYS